MTDEKELANQHQRELAELHSTIHAMSNTIEALKTRVMELEFQIIDGMAAGIAASRAVEELNGPPPSELPDGSNN